MKLNALLTSVFTTLGIDPQSQEAQALLGNATLTSIDVADDLSNKLKGPFFTKEAALASPEIRSVIKAETLNGVDQSVLDLLDESFDEESKNLIKSEKQTAKKLKLYSDKVKELEAKKAGASGKTQTELTKKIDELNLEKSNLVKDHQAKIAEMEQASKMARVNWEHESFYGELEYALPKEMPKEIKIETAKAIINRRMKEKNLRFEASENGIEILTQEGTKYVDNNNFVSHKDFIKKTLLESKLLQVSDTSSGKQQQTSGSGKQPVNYSNSDFMTSLNERMAEAKVS